MKCENCLQEHDGTYGSGRFCKAACARCFSSKLKREEINEKVSKTMLGRKNLTSVGFTDEQREKAWSTRRRNVVLERERKLKELSFDQLSVVLKREKIRREQDNSCLICKFKEWNSQPILLELDHIDGNKENEKRENLRMICPNCHSQTETYKTKNMSDEVRTNWIRKHKETYLRKLSPHTQFGKAD